MLSASSHVVGKRVSIRVPFFILIKFDITNISDLILFQFFQKLLHIQELISSVLSCCLFFFQNSNVSKKNFFYIINRLFSPVKPLYMRRQASFLETPKFSAYNLWSMTVLRKPSFHKAIYSVPFSVLDGWTQCVRTFRPSSLVPSILRISAFSLISYKPSYPLISFHIISPSSSKFYLYSITIISI